MWEPAVRAADLGQTLQALAHGERLKIVRFLLNREATAGEIADALAIGAGQARRQLRALTAAGLVDSYPSAEGERFKLDQQAVALVSASVIRLLTPGPGGARRPGLAGADDADVFTIRVPDAPATCLSCQNSPFVAKVLDDLDTVLREARAYHSRLLHLSSQVLTAHEAERKRIARELHDDTAQSLTSILVRLRLLERSLKNSESRRKVEELHDLTGTALDSVRRMAVDLRPTALDDLGLEAALRSYIEKFCSSWPVQVRFSTTNIRRRLPPDVELVLYRVAQEALSNIAKHSSARSAEVSLVRRSNVVTLTIRDDGRGFDPANLTPSSGGGLGLFGMRERMSLVGGSLEIDSAPDSGARITGRVSLRGRAGAAR